VWLLLYSVLWMSRDFILGLSLPFLANPGNWELEITFAGILGISIITCCIFISWSWSGNSHVRQLNTDSALCPGTDGTHGNYQCLETEVTCHEVLGGYIEETAEWLFVQILPWSWVTAYYSTMHRLTKICVIVIYPVAAGLVNRILWSSSVVVCICTSSIVFCGIKKCGVCFLKFLIFSIIADWIFTVLISLEMCVKLLNFEERKILNLFICHSFGLENTEL